MNQETELQIDPVETLLHSELKHYLKNKYIPTRVLLAHFKSTISKMGMHAFKKILSTVASCDSSNDAVKYWTAK